MTIHSAQLAGRIMKVNHAGEHGAISIYTGQISMAGLDVVACRVSSRNHPAPVMSRTLPSPPRQRLPCVLLPLTRA